MKTVLDAPPLDGLPEPYGLLAAILQDGTNEWRTELWDTFGPEVTTWRSRPGGPSIGAQILHMIDAEIYWFEQVALRRPRSEEESRVLLSDQFDIDNGIWPEPPAEPLSWYFELQDRYRARTLRALEAWAAQATFVEHHGRQVTLRWIFGHVIQHESYHGGQVVMLYDLWKHQAPR